MEAGLAVLRALAADVHYLDPVHYARVRRELGLKETGDAATTLPASKAVDPGTAQARQLADL